MKKNLLNDYVVERLKSVKQNLSDFKKAHNSECLHDLRVDIKKIRSIVSFAEKVCHKKYATSDLKPLFKNAGKIRELEINIQMLIADPNPPKKLVSQLKKKKNLLTLSFLKKTSRYIRLTERQINSVSFPEKLPKTKEIKKYFEKVERKANQMLSGDRESMHKFRMKIKNLMYVYKALPENLQNKINWDAAEIDKRQEKLGIWHDTYVAVNFFSQEKFPKKSAEFMLKLKELEKTQFSSLFKNKDITPRMHEL